jgi:Glyoxalase-like domain
MTLRLRQICLVAPRLEPVAQAIEAIFGLPVCHRDPAVGRYGLENALFVCGHQFLEVVAPTREGTAAGRFLHKHGGRGGYMAIFDTHDPERRQAHVQALGIRIAHVIDRPGFFGIQLHPVDCRATMLEFDRSEGNERLDGAYWPAGPLWRDGQRLDRVCGLPSIDVQSPTPQALAAHWSRIIDAPLLRGADGAPLLRFDLGEVRFVHAAGAAECLQALHIAVTDPAAVWAAAIDAGCVTEGEGADRGFVLAGVRFVPQRTGDATSKALSSA